MPLFCSLSLKLNVSLPQEKGSYVFLMRGKKVLSIHLGSYVSVGDLRSTKRWSSVVHYKGGIWSSVNLLVVLDRSMLGPFLLQVVVYFPMFVCDLIGAGVVFSPCWQPSLYRHVSRWGFLCLKMTAQFGRNLPFVMSTEKDRSSCGLDKLVDV